LEAAAGHAFEQLAESDQLRHKWNLGGRGMGGRRPCRHSDPASVEQQDKKTAVDSLRGKKHNEFKETYSL